MAALERDEHPAAAGYAFRLSAGYYGPCAGYFGPPGREAAGAAAYRGIGQSSAGVYCRRHAPSEDGSGNGDSEHDRHEQLYYGEEVDGQQGIETGIQSVVQEAQEPGGTAENGGAGAGSVMARAASAVHGGGAKWRAAAAVAGMAAQAPARARAARHAGWALGPGQGGLFMARGGKHVSMHLRAHRPGHDREPAICCSLWQCDSPVLCIDEWAFPNMHIKFSQPAIRAALFLFITFPVSLIFAPFTHSLPSLPPPAPALQACMLAA